MCVHVGGMQVSWSKCGAQRITCKHWDPRMKQDTSLSGEGLYPRNHLTSPCTISFASLVFVQPKVLGLWSRVGKYRGSCGEKKSKVLCLGKDILCDTEKLGFSSLKYLPNGLNHSIQFLCTNEYKMISWQGHRVIIAVHRARVYKRIMKNSRYYANDSSNFFL